MSEKEVFVGGDRLRNWFYRQPLTHIVRKVEAFAFNQGLPTYSPDTFESALRGNKVFAGVVEVLRAFEDHVDENLRQYYVPPEPPLSREELIPWVKDNMTQTWLFNCLQIPGLSFSTFSNFFNPVKGVSDDVCEKIVSGIHEWYKDLIKKFDYYEARYERQEARQRELAKIRSSIRERVQAELRAEWEGQTPRLIRRREDGTELTEFDVELQDRLYEEAVKILGPLDFLKELRLPHQMVAE